VRTKTTLDLNDCELMGKFVVETVASHADAKGPKSRAPVVVAVVGDEGQLLWLKAMDGAEKASHQIAQSKAYTAVRASQDTVNLRGVDATNFVDPKVTAFGGGVAIRVAGEIVGGIGVSGRYSTRAEAQENGEATDFPQDHELGQAAVERFFQHHNINADEGAKP